MSSSSFDLITQVPKQTRGDEPSEVISPKLIFLSGHPARFWGAKSRQAAVHVSKYMRENHNISLIVNCCAPKDAPMFLVEDIRAGEKRAVGSVGEFLSLIKEERSRNQENQNNDLLFFHFNLALKDDDDEDISSVFELSNQVLGAFVGDQIKEVLEKISSRNNNNNNNNTNQQEPPSTTTEAPSAVLVHCHAGASRSVSILTAFLMKYFGEGDSEKVISFLESRRQTVNPNPGYREILKAYGKTL